MDILTKAEKRFRNWLFNEQPDDEPAELSAEQAALQTLGISVEEYEEILRVRNMSKLNQSLRFASQTDESMGSFLSKAFYRYLRTKGVEGNTWKRLGSRRILRELRRELSRNNLDEGDLLHLVTLIYRLYRYKRTGQ